jgi:hypothetical protein
MIYSVIHLSIHLSIQSFIYPPSCYLEGDKLHLERGLSVICGIDITLSPPLTVS